ncbi:NMCC_0638 family (lipo)protein [Dyella sp.]|uniref:NMCC_0638 family (lipo)protein n=1 Tax=Dyella sp. TaxID=1869338 RepID=UPI002D76F547|nr:hypothetical protein [Dyella sp.]HET7332242.1 hypothetical protein [Dyella sp.]
MRGLLIAISLVLVMLPARPARSNDSDSFTALFAITCMKYFYSHDQLRAQMASSNVPTIPQDRAASFLGGAHGTAWLVLQDGQRYVVVLRDDDICGVYAEHAAVDVVQKNFVALVGEAPAPLTAVKLDGAVSGPDSGALHTIAYGWSRPQDDSQLTFTLTTSTTGVPVQAMATLAYSKKRNPL